MQTRLWKKSWETKFIEETWFVNTLEIEKRKCVLLKSNCLWTKK